MIFYINILKQLYYKVFLKDVEVISILIQNSYF